jgi:hypothetical protein
MRPEIKDSTYSLLENPTSWQFAVRLEEGQYNGVTFRYGKVSASMDNETMTPKLSFQFQLDIVPAPHNKDELEQSGDFKNLLGDVLTHILDKAFQTGHYKLGNGRKSPIDNSTKADR